MELTDFIANSPVSIVPAVEKANELLQSSSAQMPPIRQMADTHPIGISSGCSGMSDNVNCGSGAA